MNKPSWDNAPEWARWLAMDANSQWYWYRVKPRCGRLGWLPRNHSYEGVGGLVKDYFQLTLAKTLFKTTLEKRP